MESFNPYATGSVAESPPETRADFIRKTYTHLAGALAAFAVLEAVMLSMGLGDIALSIIGSHKFAWLGVLGGFMVVGWLASRLASSAASPGTQYLGLALYTFAEAIIFLPLMAMAIHFTGSAQILGQAAVLTGALVLGITTVAFTTRKDFSFLGGILKIGGFVALGLIVASFFLPISLGLWFSVAMVIFAGGAVLYDTSNIIHRYQPGDHVAASLSLFASIALLLWYVIRILLAFSGRD